MSQDTIIMKWAWNPEDIGGRRLILVQNGTMDKDHWQALTDAIQGLEKRPEVVKAQRTPNNFVHAIKFKDDPVTRELLASCEAFIENVYNAQTEGRGDDPHPLKWELAEPVADRIIKERPPPAKKQKPPKLKDVLASSAAKQIHKLRDEAMRAAITKLDAAIEAGEIDGAEAYQLLKLVIVGER